MNVRRGLFRLWIVASIAWMLLVGSNWWRTIETDREKISALDECGKIYPPTPNSSAASAGFDPNYCVGKAPPCNVFDQFDAQPRGKIVVEQLETYPTKRDLEREAERQHPRCAPKVGTLGFFEFVSMSEADRVVLRQRSERAIRLETQDAMVYGALVPAALLAFGLILGWIIRGFRG